MGARPVILVVDDHAHNVELLEAMLVPQGYEVLTAGDGIEALASVSQRIPDLVVLDIMMPRMDGFEVTTRLRADEATRAIPILMLTALRDLSDKVHGLEVGADDFLSKPFNRVELLARVRSLLRIKQLHDALEQKSALLRQVLTRYVAEDVANEILANPDVNLRLGGQSARVSVLFADIRGFTSFTEDREAPIVLDTLNAIFSKLVPEIFSHRGTFDKYLGDAVMAFYGAPMPYEDDALRAVQTAVSMQQVFSSIREYPNLDLLGLGIGIYTGEAVVGNLGTGQVMDYTVIGDTPNSAKRLQENAAAGQILICQTTFEAVRNHVEVRPIEPLMLKGKKAAVPAYEVMAIQPMTVP